MEYAVQAWSPWLQKDISLLQRIYHRTTKLVRGLKHKQYEDRITSLNLCDSRYCRLIGRPGLTLLEDDRGGTKVHIETPIERGYVSTDMIVRVDPGEIVISGSKAIKGPTGNNESRHVNEFSRAYRIPGRVDTEAIKTRGRRDVFVVEAPLVSWD